MNNIQIGSVVEDVNLIAVVIKSYLDYPFVDILYFNGMIVENVHKSHLGFVSKNLETYLNGLNYENYIKENL